ncbi:hypothetical protein F5B20DRAFT_429995 [Whalleya microplaca]|nr:hypothetical protein F5B20DRAFT_429995 [Whalleya microplaca]
MDSSQNGTGPLEDHLRNLILSNSEQPTRQTPPVSVASPIESGPLRGKSGDGDNQQRLGPSQAPLKGGSKKRPNQAQRRQMHAQLSVPIDTRAPGPPHAAKPYVNSPQYHNQHSGWRSSQQGTFRHSGAQHGGSQDHVPMVNSPPYSGSRHHQAGFGQAAVSPSSPQPNWGHQQTPRFDGFSKGVNVVSADAFPPRNRHPSQNSLYNPSGHRQFNFSPEQLANQSALLEQLCHMVIAGAEIEPSEIAEKENFRSYVEAICRDVISHHEIQVNNNRGFQPQTVQLKCFGSLSSGFATKAADMDLGLISPMSQSSPDAPDSPIPRLIEKTLLDVGFGARLLTRTRVPIIKLCEKPNDKLRLDLVEERAKWEKGLHEDGHEVIDDVQDDHEAPDGIFSAADLEAEHTAMNNQRRGSQQHPGNGIERTYEERLAWLKQAETQSLMGYYGNAKRLLRQLRGRDITHSNSGDFKPADFDLLNDVCVAFVNGLYDENLKMRIQRYPSFNPDVMSKLPNFRSLFGIVTMVEGEKLVMLWETTAAIEGDSKLEQKFNHVIHAWKTLQSKRSFGTDPLIFNRELHASLERLRQIPVIQLIQLKQEQYESPTQYHLRTVKIMTELNNTQPSSNLTLLPQVIQYYIAGIRDKHERDEVQDFAASTGVQSLRTIARKHKSLHLAADYERAIEKNLYRDEDLPAINEYIAILRGNLRPPVRHTNSHIIDPLDLVVPVTDNNTALLRRIKQLPDPSRLPPNQPRDRYHDSLEFPKGGIGVQCDINFSAHMALQNTLLLRCYSYTDPRVRPLVLFVKHWAKARGINTPYRGTLSSYGYVLMMLHYLVNIAEPFVCPNLQELAPPDPNLPPEALEGLTTCKGRNVRFWRDEQEIQRLASEGHLNQNRESLGFLLRGFFEYYAQGSMMSTVAKRGFDWGRDVLSLRTHGGLLSKQEKGWTGARTVFQLQTGAPPNPAEIEAATGPLKSPTPADTNNNNTIAAPHATTPTQPEHPPVSPGGPTTPMGGPQHTAAKSKELKEIRHRFLFAIEDPFELEHNVARTVTHNGIVSIRDEFRRAWRIIKASSSGKNSGGGAEELLEDIKVQNELAEKTQFAELLDEIHGPL